MDDMSLSLLAAAGEQAIALSGEDKNETRLHKSVWYNVDTHHFVSYVYFPFRKSNKVHVRNMEVFN